MMGGSDMDLKSDFMKLAHNDYVKAFVETVIGGVVGYLYPVFMGHGIFNWQSAKLALFVAISAGIRKVLTTYFTNSQGQILKIEPPK
jgi:hypothetical protein